MNSNNPITIDNKIYDKLTLNLALSTIYNISGENDTSVAIRAIPTCTDSDGVHNVHNETKTIYCGKLSELSDLSDKVYLLNILNNLQDLINSKGW